MIRSLWVFTLMLTLASASHVSRAADAAGDRVFVNARIWTGDPTRPEADAMLVRGNRILAIGNDADVRARADAGASFEDLDGRRVLPGFHDAHWHLPARATAELVGARDVQDIQRRLQAFAAGLPDGAWLTGRGWAPDMFPDHAAHRRYLDDAFPGRPVQITDRDGHQVLANSRALALAGVDAATETPDGGEIGRDPDGAPTGLLKETAMALVRRLLPPPTEDEAYAALRAEMDKAASFGLTALQMANHPDPPQAAALQRALAEQALKVRFLIAVPFSADAAPVDIARYAAMRDAHQGPLLRYGVAKAMLDGTVDGATAAMLVPFALAEGSGIARWEQDSLNAMAARYDAAGLQLQLHAIGDRAIRMALDAFEHVRKVSARDLRHRVEHLEVPDPADLPRFAELGVIASVQPIFATPDATTLNSYAPMLGPERAARANNFRALEQARAPLAFGSDYPVFPMDPMLGIYTAVTRQLPDGSPTGGWYPENRIALDTALRHYTRGSAYASHREHELGMLAEGMLADFVVLSEDIIDRPPAVLLSTRVLLTVMGGKDTWRAEAGPSP